MTRRAHLGGFLKGDGRPRMAGWRLLGGKLSAEDGSSRKDLVRLNVEGFRFRVPLGLGPAFASFAWSSKMTDSGLKVLGLKRGNGLGLQQRRRPGRTCCVDCAEIVYRT